MDLSSASAPDTVSPDEQPQMPLGPSNPEHPRATTRIPSIKQILGLAQLNSTPERSAS
jgi:hypothetical protein